MRLRIRETFAAPLYETYASHECPLMAWECRHSGDLHTCDDGVLVEVLRDGRAVDPGERGEVVVTNLHAYAMPFIRYRIGDLATRGAPCGCGAPFSTIGEIQGRMIDYFPLPDGRLLHPYEIVSRLVWGPREWMRQYQLVQERRDRVVLYAVADEPPSAERLQEIERVVRPILGAGVEFEVRLVGRIPFESTGKLRPSRSLVHSEYDRVRFAPVSPDRPPADSAPTDSTSTAWARCARCTDWAKRSRASTGTPSARCSSPARATPCASPGRWTPTTSASSPAWGWGRGRSTSSSPAGTVAARAAPSPSGCWASPRS